MNKGLLLLLAVGAAGGAAVLFAQSRRMPVTDAPTARDDRPQVSAANIPEPSNGLSIAYGHQGFVT